MHMVSRAACIPITTPPGSCTSYVQDRTTATNHCCTSVGGRSVLIPMRTGWKLCLPVCNASQGTPRTKASGGRFDLPTSPNCTGRDHIRFLGTVMSLRRLVVGLLSLCRHRHHHRSSTSTLALLFLVSTTRTIKKCMHIFILSLALVYDLICC